MANGDKKVEFTQAFAGLKKSHKSVYSRDLANMLIKKGVAKEVKQGTKGRKPKAKAKK